MTHENTPKCCKCHRTGIWVTHVKSALIWRIFHPFWYRDHRGTHMEYIQKR